MSDWPHETPFFWQEVTKIAKNNPITEHFKTDYIVRRVPLYSHKMTSYLLLHLQEIFEYIEQQDPATKVRMKNALEERPIGHDPASYELFTFTPRFDYPNVSAWTIKCFHHAMMLEKLSRRSIQHYSHIVEIGAGAGELCRILYDGFNYKGKYTILDLPEILMYADHNLVNYPVKFETKLDGVKIEDEPTLVIGTWSLSEMEYAERNRIMDYCSSCDLFVSFQATIFGNDNRLYFVQQYPTKYKKNITLQQIPMHLADNGNFYMFAG
jgi:hypothetical protein